MTVRALRAGAPRPGSRPPSTRCRPPFVSPRRAEPAPPAAAARGQGGHPCRRHPGCTALPRVGARGRGLSGGRWPPRPRRRGRSPGRSCPHGSDPRRGAAGERPVRPASLAAPAGTRADTPVPRRPRGGVGVRVRGGSLRDGGAMPVAGARRPPAGFRQASEGVEEQSPPGGRVGPAEGVAGTARQADAPPLVAAVAFPWPADHALALLAAERARAVVTRRTAHADERTVVGTAAGDAAASAAACEPLLRAGRCRTAGAVVAQVVHGPGDHRVPAVGACRGRHGRGDAGGRARVPGRGASMEA